MGIQFENSNLSEWNSKIKVHDVTRQWTMMGSL